MTNDEFRIREDLKMNKHFTILNSQFGILFPIPHSKFVIQ